MVALIMELMDSPRFEELTSASQDDLDQRCFHHVPWCSMLFHAWISLGQMVGHLIWILDTVQWVNFWFTLTRRSDIVAMLLAQAGSLESLGTCQVFWHRFSWLFTYGRCSFLFLFQPGQIAGFLQCRISSALLMTSRKLQMPEPLIGIISVGVPRIDSPMGNAWPLSKLAETSR